MKEGVADDGGAFGMGTGTEYARGVDDTGTGVETGGGVGRGCIALWAICSDTEIRTS
jgi:hypothetical protein